MKNSVLAGVAGFIFSVGLGIAGMTKPQKIIGFLDVFGNWDPSLLFVMAGAVAVHFVCYRLIRKRPHPLYARDWHVPDRSDVSKNLMIGSAIFGMGWGLGGYCPGPAVTALGSFDYRPAIFVVGMLMGMLIFKALDKKMNFGS